MKLDELEAKYKELGAEIERLKAKKRPELMEGQIWRHKDGGLFLSHLAHNDDSSEKCRLTRWETGLRWDFRPWFAGCDEDFEYVGLARDLIQIKDPAK